MKIQIIFLAIWTILIIPFPPAIGEVQLTNLNEETDTFDEAYGIFTSTIPLFHISLYFADGALSDPKGKTGASVLMFSHLASGTNRYDQKEIADSLGHFAATINLNVTHEFSLFTFSGLSRDVVPITKMICHLFKDATFPESELAKDKVKIIADRNNLVTNHGALADELARRASLKNTVLEIPASGIISTIQRITRNDLYQRRNDFLQRVQKKVFLSGPKGSHVALKILNEECGFASKEVAKYKRAFTDEMQNAIEKKASQSSRIHFLSVPRANQAQLRWVKLLGKTALPNPFNLMVAQDYLGGGFQSLLFQEIRVKRGLTYSIFAVGANQRDYHRNIISTFTANENLAILIPLLRNVLKQSPQLIDEHRLNGLKKRLLGTSLFNYVLDEQILSHVINLMHQGRPLDDFFNLSQKLSAVTLRELQHELESVWAKDLGDLVVVGDKSLLKELKQFGNVQVTTLDQVL